MGTLARNRLKKPTFYMRITLLQRSAHRERGISGGKIRSVFELGKRNLGN